MSESLTNDTIRVYWNPIESELVTKYWCILSTQRAYWDEEANNISPTSSPSFWNTEEAIYDHDDVVLILSEIDTIKNSGSFNGFIGYKSALNVSGGNGSGDLSGKFVIDFEDTNIINQPYYIYIIAERISSSAFTSIPNNVAGVVDISETLPPPTANAKYLNGQPDSFYLSFANMTDDVTVGQIYDFTNIVNGMIEAASGTAAEISYDDTNNSIVVGGDVQAAIGSIDTYLDNLELQTMGSNITPEYLFKSGINGSPVNSTNTDTEINNAVIHSNIVINNPHNVLKSDIIKSGSYIVNDDIDFNAGILGTKINPNFGNLNIKTTGNVILGDSLSPSYVNSNLLNVDGDAYISGVLKDANSKNVSILDLSNGLDKLGTIESYADKTDATNVAAAGAVMYNDGSTALMNFVIDEDTMVSNLDTKVPTQQSVKAYVDGVVASSINYRGGYDANTNTPDLDTAPSGVSKGDMYTVTVAGTFFTAGVEVGDVLISEIDSPTLESDWTIVNKNLDDASIKVAYENNPDTNAFTDANVNKLNSIESNAKDLTIHNIGELADVDTSNVLDGQVLAYNSTLLKYTPITVDSFAGKTTDDLPEGTINKYDTENAVTIQGIPVSAVSPGDGDALIYNAASNDYEPIAVSTDLSLHNISELKDITNNFIASSTGINIIEDFESTAVGDTPTGWVIDSQYTFISDDTNVYSGIHSGKLSCPTSHVGDSIGISKALNYDITSYNAEYETIEFAIFRTDYNDYSYIRLINTFGGIVCNIVFNDTEGAIFAYDGENTGTGTWKKIVPYYYNNWYKIKIVFITRNIWNVYIYNSNNEFIGSSINLSTIDNSEYDISKFLYTFANTGLDYIDSINQYKSEIAGNTISSYHTRMPSLVDDINSGYYKGSIWLNYQNNILYECIDNTPGAAVWNQINGNALSIRGINISNTQPNDGDALKYNALSLQYEPVENTSVELLSDQTIYGIKTFIKFPEKSYSGSGDYEQPATPMQFAHKNYVDKVRPYNYIVGAGAGADYSSPADVDFSGGDISVFIRNGIYPMSNPLNLENISNVVIEGQNKFQTELDFSSAALKLDGATNIIFRNLTLNLTSSSYFFSPNAYASNLNHIVFDNVKISGLSGAYGLYFYLSYDILLYRCSIIGSGTYDGLVLQFVTNAYMLNNIISGSFGQAPIMVATGNNNLYIMNNSISNDLANWLLFMRNGYGATIENNTLFSNANGGTGIYINDYYSQFPINNNKISFNRFSNLDYGIQITKGSNNGGIQYNDISHNLFDNINTYNIYNQAGTDFQNNKVVDNIYIGSATVSGVDGQLNDVDFGDNYGASGAPTADDDRTQAHSVGSIWVDTTNGVAYMCVDSTTGAAVWKQITA